jgi:hypothetical protein
MGWRAAGWVGGRRRDRKVLMKMNWIESMIAGSGGAQPDTLPDSGGTGLALDRGLYTAPGILLGDEDEDEFFDDDDYEDDDFEDEDEILEDDEETVEEGEDLDEEEEEDDEF